ncbi:MAG: IS607 family transposase [Candidatus Omnitrophica bacterium]|nr:IS607 family transposase [Candidatus Omnitrophota bacterium]MBU4141196.1 IS607 family transposase [Candidatus Omnitrophota bacterium]
MKLSTWAKRQGISYKTAWRLWASKKLPVPAEQLATGTIIVKEPATAYETAPSSAVLYARVSSSDQKQDLDRQLSRLVEYATSQGFQVKGAIKEVGSGLNGKRPKLLSILRNPDIKTIVVEHKDRLVRFGFEYMEALFKASNRRIVVVDEGEMKDDLVCDMIDVLTSFCARLYGRRSAKNKAKKAIKEIEKC